MSDYGKPVARGSFAFVVAFALACLVGLACFGQAYAAEDGTASQGLKVGTADVVTTLPTYGNDSINTNGTSNIHTVYRFGWISGGNCTSTFTTYRNLDVTGDGWADVIRVKGARVSSTSGYLKNVKVSINGKRVLSFTNTLNRINRVVVSVVTLKNKKPFLWVNILDGKGYAYQRLYQYRSGKLVIMASNKDVAKKNTSNQIITALEPDGNKVYVTYGLTNTATGNAHMKFAYVYSGGKLKRASDTTTSYSYVNNDEGVYHKGKLTAAGTFKAYTTTSLSNIAFTVKSGGKVQPVAVQLNGSKMLWRVKYGSKYGWIENPTIKRASAKSPATLFYETYGRLVLNSKIPRYTGTKLYSAKALQQYNDHALFVARNEIYARHGHVFKNGELRSRFMSTSWWSAKQTSLNGIEKANADLIASIEQNRGSLYVV